MPISRAQLLAELLPALTELFGLDYEGFATTWAVYHEYSYPDNAWKVGAIERWIPGKHNNMRNVHKVTEAADELEAYKKFMDMVNK